MAAKQQASARVITIAFGALFMACAFFLILWLYNQERSASLKLSQTQDTLSATQNNLTALEEERHKLSQAYDSLKESWGKNQEELLRLRKTSEETNEELSGVKNERENLSNQLAQMKKQSGDLSKQLTVLEVARDSLKKENSALEDKLAEMSSSSRTTKEELDSLKTSFSKQQADSEQLTEKISQLSFAYEQLAAQRMQFQREQAPAASAFQSAENANELPKEWAGDYERRNIAWRLSFNEQSDTSSEAAKYHAAPEPSDASTAASENIDTEPEFAVSEIPQEEQYQKAAVYDEKIHENRHMASFLKQEAEAYLNIGRYQQAADAFESSLAYRNDPSLHERLALIYGQKLHNPVLAKQHRAKINSSEGASNSSSSHKRDELPRSSWRLMWEWLTGK